MSVPSSTSGSVPLAGGSHPAYRRSNGVVTSDHRTLRGGLFGGGVALVAAGGAAVAIQKWTPLLETAAATNGIKGWGIAGAVVGAALIGSSYLVRPHVEHYID